MGATFTDIVKAQRSQGGGVFGSLGKATGQRTLERLDIRNYLFNRNGLLTSLFPGLKGYQAKAKAATEKISASGGTLSTGQVEILADKLDTISLQQRITAKNTLVLPVIARDMNVMRQNIVKLVKLSGGKPTNKADMFFMTEKQREDAYEARFGKKSTSPTAVGATGGKKEGGGFLSDLFSGLLKAGLIAGALAGLAKYFSDPEFRKKVNDILNNIGKAIFGADYWENIKTTLKKFAVTVLEIYAGLKVAGVLLNRQLARLALAGIPGRIATKAAATGAAEAAAGTAATAAAKKATGPTVGRDPKTGKFTKLSKKAPTKWNRFLKFLAKKSPKLFARVGAKLAAMEIGAFIPGPGWVLDILLGAFLVWDAWEIYKYYKEFDGQDNENAPTPVDKEESGNQIGREADTSDTTPSMMVSPETKAAKGELSSSQEDMANLIREKFKAAGFSDIQAEAAVANAIAESGLNPNAYVSNNKEESVGLFQMNRKNGLGKGYSVEDLKDPNKNIDLAIAAAKKSENFKSASSINDAVAAFVKDVERPANQASEIDKRTQIALNQKPGMESGVFDGASTAVASALTNLDKMTGNKLNLGSVNVNDMVRDLMRELNNNPTFINNQPTNVSSLGGGSSSKDTGSTWDRDIINALVSQQAI